jgi:hypothetical protein
MLKNTMQKMTNGLNTMSKSIKVNKDFMHNRILLYIVLLVSLLHLFYYVNVRDMRAVAIFILVGFLTSFFSKNMLIILSIALLITHIMNFGLKRINEGIDEEEEEEEEKEGMENKDEAEEEEAEEEAEKKEGMKEGKDKGETPKKPKIDVKPISEKQLESEKKKDYLEFQELQTEIMTNMQKLEPLITKAESFVEKYQEKYGSSK